MRSSLFHIVLAILIVGVFGQAMISTSGAQLPVMDFLAQTLLRFQDGVVPSDSEFFHQWGMTKVQAPQAWEIADGNSGIVIAILDSGIDLDHPDLKDKIIASANFTSSDNPDDHLGHGSHVAGIAAASSNNDYGVAGLGYNCSLMSVKVLDDNGKGYASWVADGIRWAVDNGANVINMSVVMDSPSRSLEKAVNYAWEHGAVVIAAAGNDGDSESAYPAYYSDCIAVGATNSNDNLARFSNRGDWVDVAAPGVRIYSTLDDGEYGYKSGTSAAAPHVAGLSALLFEVVEDENGNGRVNDEIRSIIESTCDRLDGVVYGRVNALKALESC
jgi:thermitase